MNTIGELLEAKVRKDSRSQNQIAKQAGISSSTISRFLRRDHRSVEIFLRLAKELGFSADEVLDELEKNEDGNFA